MLFCALGILVMKSLKIVLCAIAPYITITELKLGIGEVKM